MTIIEKFQVTFLLAFWAIIFQIAASALYLSSRKAIRLRQAAKRKKEGFVKCDAFFHCHCEKQAGHEKNHINEENMIVWE